jgi:hypothetical protein
MSRLYIPQVRLLYLTTGNTGGSLDVTGVEGQAQFRRLDPDGVRMLYAGQYLSIDKDALPTVARFFGAAAVLLGVDINEGWDQ